MIKKRTLVIVSVIGLFLMLISSCTRGVEQPPMMKINVVDRNGLSETINSEERLKQYENVDFLQPQPYQKILRVYGRDREGNVKSLLTSYHANGQPKQYLEIVNSRAFGKYREWHANGQLKLEANVIGGTPEINNLSEASWLFDGSNHVWDEEGRLVATIAYVKGMLEGDSIYYHNTGQIWKKIPYSDDQIEGVMEIFLSDGMLLQRITYIKGVEEGDAVRYWNKELIAAEEHYSHGLLQTARYYDLNHTLVAEINNGNGYKARFGKSELAELHEYHQGVPEGEVKIFNNKQMLVRLYHVKNGCKHGEEVEYFEEPPFVTREQVKPRQKMALSWYEGKIQGIVKTWFKSGQLESQREMSNNEKHGVLTAWYSEGSMMLIEEYDHGKLVKGEYYRKGERTPISEIVDGKGMATIFDAEGNFLKKIPYAQNHPLET